MAKAWNRKPIWLEPELHNEVKKESVNRDFKSISEFIRYLLTLLRGEKSGK